MRLIYELRARVVSMESGLNYDGTPHPAFIAMAKQRVGKVLYYAGIETTLHGRAYRYQDVLFDLRHRVDLQEGAPLYRYDDLPLHFTR